MTRKKRLARTGFLLITATALVMECWYAWDSNPDTEPWTDLIGDYVPWQLAVAVFGALLLWVPVHFIARYKRALSRESAMLKFALDELEGTRAALLSEQRRREADKQLDQNPSPDQGTLF